MYFQLFQQRLISIHAPREGGDDANAYAWTLIGISIHAPREGGDDAGAGIEPAAQDAISIHAPREGGDKIEY